MRRRPEVFGRRVVGVRIGIEHGCFAVVYAVQRAEEQAVVAHLVGNPNKWNPARKYARAAAHLGAFVAGHVPVEAQAGREQGRALGQLANPDLLAADEAHCIRHGVVGQGAGEYRYIHPDAGRQFHVLDAGVLVLRVETQLHG